MCKRSVRMNHILLAVALLLAFLGSPPVPRARAAGTFMVNTNGDTDIRDAYLTLREALKVANGTLTGPFTDGEKAQLGGCTFSGLSGSWLITGGCGAGIADTINFSFASGVINLNGGVLGPLPPINDSAPTYIYGPNTSLSEIAIDGTLLLGGTSILSIVSNDNIIRYSLAFRHSRGNGITITGHNNEVSYIQIYGNGYYGLEIDGGTGNDIYGVEFGLRSLDNPTACVSSDSNSLSNILLYHGAVGNTLTNNTIVCSAGYGVALSGGSTFSNTLDSNDIGVWYKTGTLYLMGNTVGGVGILSGSHNNHLLYNTIGINQDGIVLSGIGSNENVIENNYIGRYLLANIPNNRYGILIETGTQSNQVLNNTIASNRSIGVVINGSVAGMHLLQGNSIFNNKYEGVFLQGNTSNNTLEDNDIYSNGSAGVRLVGTVTNNRIVGGSIHDNVKAGILEAATTGTNWWSEVSFFDNGDLAIDRLANGVPDPPYPTITDIEPIGSSLLRVSGAAEPNTSVELYRVDPDPSGFGEGRQFVNLGVTDAAGHWETVVNSGGGCFTAFQMKLMPSGWDASEFGPNTSCVYLPLTIK